MIIRMKVDYDGDAADDDDDGDDDDDEILNKTRLMDEILHHLSTPEETNILDYHDTKVTKLRTIIGIIIIQFY